MSETYEFKGRTKEEAIKNAEIELGIDKESLEIEVEESQTKTMFSILDRSRVTVKVKIIEDKVRKNKFDVEEVEQASQKVKAFMEELKEIYSNINFKYDLKVNGRKIYVSIDNRINSKWIGARGRILEELQALLNVIATGRRGNIKVYLNVGDYKEGRERRLKKIAKEALETVRTTGKEFALEPMNSYERKIIHDFLQGESVDTTSDGIGQGRHIVVRPLD